MSVNQLIGQYYYDSTIVTEDSEKKFTSNDSLSKLPSILSTTIVQQDLAPSSYSLDVRQLLNYGLQNLKI